MAAGYFLIGETIADVREFPTAERIGSSPQGRRGAPISKVREIIRLTTEEGVEWDYHQYSGPAWRLVYRLHTPALLQFFADLDDNVNGIDKFYFCPDLSESPMQVYLVKKDKDFLPEPAGMATTSDGYIVNIYDYVLNMKEVSAAAYILA